MSKVALFAEFVSFISDMAELTYALLTCAILTHGIVTAHRIVMKASRTNSTAIFNLKTLFGNSLTFGTADIAHFYSQSSVSTCLEEH